VNYAGGMAYGEQARAGTTGDGNLGARPVFRFMATGLGGRGPVSDRRLPFAQWDASAVWPGGAYPLIGACLPPPDGAASTRRDELRAALWLNAYARGRRGGRLHGLSCLSRFLGVGSACPIF